MVFILAHGSCTNIACSNLAREILENGGWKDIAAICGNLESWRQDGLPLNPQ
jgi:hypothetical protein